MPRFRALLLVLLAGIAPALILIPSASQAASKTAPRTVGSLSVSPPAPIVGEYLAVTGTLRKKLARPITLQRLTAGKWVTVAKKKASRTGTFRFKTRAPLTAGTSKFRVSARAVKIHGVRRKAVLTPVRSVTAAAQTATLDVSGGKALVGTPYTVTATFTPARAGREVALEQLVAGVWTSLDDGAESSTGTATFAITPTEGGTATYRAVAASLNGAPESATTASDVLVQAPPRIATNSLADGFVGEPYAQSLATEDVRGGTWTLKSGALPAGLTLRTNGTITGTPTGSTSSTVLTFAFTDDDNLVSTRPLRLNVWSTPSITTQVPAIAVVGEAYHQTLATADGRTGAWAITSGTLPAGLALDASTGVVSGTPTGAAGIATLTLGFTDADGLKASSTVQFAVRRRPVIVHAALTDAIAGDAYTQTLATGDARPGSWAVTSGSLPVGLGLNPSTGAIAGTPAGPAGSSTFTVTFTDADNLSAATDLVLKVLTKPSITTTTLPTAVAGDSYSQALSNGDGRPGSWAITTGTLPAGLSLTAGAITGTPTGAAGTANFTVTFTDGNGLTGTTDLELTVLIKPTIVSKLPLGVPGEAYDEALTVRDARLGTWVIISGSLPAGLTFDSSMGAIIGTPATPGTSTFTVRFIDGNTLADTADINLTIAEVTWRSIDTNTEVTCGVKPDKTGWCWGYNYRGQVGDGTGLDSSTPQQLPGRWKTMTVGWGTTCGIQADNTGWCWGTNEYGQVGSGDFDTASTPRQVPGSWTSITPTGPTTCGIRTNGSGWCWGQNDQGQVGNGTPDDQPSPQLLTGDWLTLESHESTTCGIKADHSGWCWGQNYSGQVGNGSTATALVPQELPGTWRSITSRWGTTCGVGLDDSGWCWGNNGSGQIGDGTFDTEHLSPYRIEGSWRSFSTEVTTCGVKTDNTAWCWGYSGQGQAGVFANSPGWNTPNQIPGSWKSMNTYAGTTCGVQTDDTGWCFGNNGNGQIGNGTSGNSTTVPQQVPGIWASITSLGFSTVGTRADNTFWAWGFGYSSSPTKLG